MKYLLCIVSVLLTCCSSPKEKEQNIADSNIEILNRIKYYKDLNTNLCFTAAYLEGNSAILSNVPCTPEVEKIVIHFTSH